MSFTGLLNTTVTIQSRTNTGTDFHPDYTWVTFATLKARRNKLSEAEQPKSEGIVVLADYRFYTDYKSGVTNVMRVLHNSIYYNIYDSNNIDDMDHHLEIKALKDQPGAS